MTQVESDVLDYLFENMVHPEELFSNTDEFKTTQKTKQTTVEPIKTTSFEELISIYKKPLFITQSIEDTLATMLATSISTSMGGAEKLWFYIMGPPGAGKSTLCEGMATDRKHCISLDKFTGFISGFKQGKSKKNFSLLDDINNKTVIIRDFTSVLSLPEDIQRKIYGELRFLSDGSANTQHLNGQKLDMENIRFSMLCGVTDKILRLRQSGLGERFLMIDITDRYHGSQEHVKQALNSIWSSLQASFPQKPKSEETEEEYELLIPPDRLLEIKQHTLGFMNYIHQEFHHIKPPDISDKFIEYCTSIGRFVGMVRGQVDREGINRDLTHKPRPEIGVRLGSQLLKLGVSLAVIFQKEFITKKIVRIVRKVACDTSRGYNFDIVRRIALENQHGGMGLNNEQISNKLAISKSDVQRRIADLHVLGLVERAECANNSGRGGRHSHIWRLRKEFHEQWEHLNGEINS